MVKTHALPQSTPNATLLSQSLQKYTMRSTSTPENVLRKHPAKIHHHIATIALQEFRRKKGETPEAQCPSQRDDRHTMSGNSGRRRDPVFSAKKVHIVP